VKTRDKILYKSQELFNARGERNVTTNHIAAELGISPGNLYYHFRNKEEIIFQLFLMYESSTQSLLMTPSDRDLTYGDKIVYFEGILDNMWEYRFLHRDLEQMFDGNPALRERYRNFARLILCQGRLIFERLAESGLVQVDEDAIEALIINIWVITSSWISFLHTSGIYGENADINRELLQKGIYQIVMLEAPYLRGEARDKLPEMKRHYGGITPPAM
jgi:AcrR family transcriptional regulator